MKLSRMRRGAAFALVLSSLTFWPRWAAAQAPPSLDQLRARVAQARSARPTSVPEGSLVGIEYLLDVAGRIEDSHPPQSVEWRARAARYLASVESGRDPYLEARGQITNRGYQSPISMTRQGYAVYLPPNYDPTRRYPLLVMMHGGSSNGNLFLGVTLGNNMDWLTYPQHLWDEYTPTWSPDWIVVAPDGFGQVLWRWMGEEDVLSVIDDVSRHYSVDADRVVLCGLSNGGLGAYAIGTRHAWRFSLVLAIAGAPSWVQYTGGSPTRDELRLLHPLSGMHLIENSLDTDFRFFHGTRDPGPMRPRYVTELEEHMRRLGVPSKVRWFDFGHDLLYLVHRHGRAYEGWAAVRRNPRPADVRLVTGDYRANRQHWIRVTRIDEYPNLARVTGHAAQGRIELTTERVLELELEMNDVPIEGDVTVSIDGREVYRGAKSGLGAVAKFSRAGGVVGGAFQRGSLPAPPAGTFEKVPGLSGPLTDFYRESAVHVYGTAGDEATTTALRAAAERGARGWPQWLWNVQQRVVADTEVDDAMMRRSHLVLYATPGTHRLLTRIESSLPIRIDAQGVTVGTQTYRGEGVGTRFIHPNPLAPQHYVIVQAAPNVRAVNAGHNLPDFVPDWVVYDARTTRTRPRLIAGRRGAVAEGFFDRFWRVPSAQAANSVLDHTRLALGEVPIEVAFPGKAAIRDDIVRVQNVEGDAQSVPATRNETEVQRILREERNARIGAPPDFVIPSVVLEQTPRPQLSPGELPPAPERPRRFAAPRTDPAGAIARILARQVPTFLNYRAIIPGGQWWTRPSAVWRIQPQARCLATLDGQRISYSVAPPPRTPVPSPIYLDGPVGGVEFRNLMPEEGPLLMSCELARRLPEAARILRDHRLRTALIASAYRATPSQSFHRNGLALDIYGFEDDDGRTWVIEEEFVESANHRTCDPEAARGVGRVARELDRVVCELARSDLWSSVLTPNYNEGHRDHLHLDARPDDSRVFVR